MLNLSTTKLALWLIPILVNLTQAKQACYNLGYGPQGVCNSDPNSPALLQVYMVQDHFDPLCAGGGDFTAVAKFTDTVGVVKTITAIRTAHVAATFTGLIPFSFTQPLSAIATDNPVSIILQATDKLHGGAVSETVFYTQAHTSTLKTTQSTVTDSKTLTSTSRKHFERRALE